MLKANHIVKSLICLSLVMIVSTNSLAEVPIAQISGKWWQVAGNPDLGEYTSDKQEPVDFTIWQAADGTWQLWSCIRNTGCGGHTRLFFRWEGRELTDANWRPKGIAMRADTALGGRAPAPSSTTTPNVCVGPCAKPNHFPVSRGEQNRTSFVVSKTGISLSASRLEGGRA